MKSNSINEHKEANKILETYSKKKSDYIFIHYARQNCFEDAYEKGPRVIAIVVTDADSGQTMVFSLKKIADEQGNNFFEVSNEEKDKIEKMMLSSFFDYAKKNKQKIWLHWNMKNNNFGFSAIEERYKNLGGNPEHFEENMLINISTVLRRKYGMDYARNALWNGKEMGKMYDIFQLNNIKDGKILNGEQEIKEYILKNINSIEQSLLNKVKAFQMIVEYACDNVLVTRGKMLRDVYGFSISGIFEYIQNNALLAFLSSIIGGIVSAVICMFLGI